MGLILLSYTVLGILAFALVMGGLAIGFVVPEPRPNFGLGMSAVGVALTVWSVREVIRINGQMLTGMFETAAGNPELAIAQWVDADGREVVFAFTGVFLDRGKEWYGFDSAAQRLDQIAYEQGMLKITVHYLAGRYDGYRDLELQVPQEHDFVVRTAVDTLLEALSTTDGVKS